MSESYASLISRDPLAAPSFKLITTDNVNKVLDGDFLIDGYINKLNEEIYDDAPDGIEPDVWFDNKLGELSTLIATEIRKPWGWCVVKFYKDGDYRILGEADRTEWIYSDKEIYMDNNNLLLKSSESFLKNKVVIGFKATYELLGGDTITDEIIPFVEPFNNGIYLIKYNKSLEKNKFAKGDLNLSIWTIATNIRQTRANIASLGAKPSFKFVKYAGGVKPEAESDFKKAMCNVDIINGVGASEDIVVDIIDVTNSNSIFVLDVLEKQLNIFSSATRLPLCFFMGERQHGSGMGENAEYAEEYKIEKKKLTIFNKLKSHLKIIFSEQYAITNDFNYHEISIEDEDDEDDESKDDNNNKNSEDSIDSKDKENEKSD